MLLDSTVKLDGTVLLHTYGCNFDAYINTKKSEPYEVTVFHSPPMFVTLKYHPEKDVAIQKLATLL